MSWDVQVNLNDTSCLGCGYGIYETGMGLSTLRHVAYDVDMAIQWIREVGLPEENGLRPLKGSSS